MVEDICCYSRQNESARMVLTRFERALYLPSNTLLDIFDVEGGDFGTIHLQHYPGKDKRDGTAIQRSALIVMSTCRVATKITSATKIANAAIVYAASTLVQS